MYKISELVLQRCLQAGAQIANKEAKMRSQIVGLRIAAIVFELVFLAHLFRVLTRVDVVVAGHEVPVWANVVGAVISGALGWWMWKLAGHRTIQRVDKIA